MGYTKELEVAKSAAKEAGKKLMELFDKQHVVKVKDHYRGFVTEADIASEKIILSLLKENFPDYSIFSEEAGRENKKSEYLWLVDPLDGTTNFKIRVPYFNVSIGLAKGNQIVAGAVYFPILDELFYAEIGKGAFLNGKKIHASQQDQISNSVIGFCHGGKDPKSVEKTIKIYSNLKSISIHTRQFGAAALEFCYVACGRIDVFEVTDSNLYDVGAGVLIAKEAGATVTDFSGNKWDISKKLDILATNGKFHKEILEIIHNL